MKRILSWLMRRWLLSLLGVLLLALLVWFEAPLLSFDGHSPFASPAVRQGAIVLMLLAWAGYFGARMARARIAGLRLMAGIAGTVSPAPARAGVHGAASAEAGNKAGSKAGNARGHVFGNDAGNDAGNEVEYEAGNQASHQAEHEAHIAAAHEVTALSARMQQAVALLRKTAGGRMPGSQFLYQLPWYMFVGAPGSGKTTALVHSGLTFPLADSMGSGAIGGVGGTRNCDWWFTDEAVLLDTAGRYTTQDSHAAADHAAWTGFLDLLKKNRRRRPINGVIVTVSVADLLQQDADARQAQARAIRARIQELLTRFGMSFPVYLVVTKCDLLAGFVEFFDQFGREERSQVWGMTFALPGCDSKAAGGRDTGSYTDKNTDKNAGKDVGAAGSEFADRTLAQFAASFRMLERQLSGRVPVRLLQERDLQRRALLYRFPQQFAAIGETLETFARQVFAPSRYEKPAMLRGVYFTSGTQQGSPIDRVMNALGASFGLSRKQLPPNMASGRSYFLTALLRELIFREAGLAGFDLAGERRQRHLRWLAMGLTVTIFLLLGSGLLNSHVRNKAAISQMRERAATVEKLAAALPPGAGLTTLLPLLAAARELPGGYAQRDAPVSLLDRLGLYQGDKLGDGARALYLHLLSATLAPRIVGRLEEVLRRGDANRQEYLYETLRVYLMMGERRHRDPAAVQAWLDVDLRRNLAGASVAQREELMAHVSALLGQAGADTAAAPVPDASLVARTRLTLAMLPLPQRLYERLRGRLADARLAEFSVNGAAGRNVSAVLMRQSGEPLSRGIPGLYSVAGYRALQKELPLAMLDITGDKWVLARQESVDAVSDNARLQAAVLELYYDDYIRLWDSFLADVRLVPFSSLDQGARVSRALAGADSPLRSLLLAAARETRLDAQQPGLPGAAAVSAMREKIDAARKKLESALGTGDALPAGPGPGPENPVDRHFEALHKLAGLGDAGAAAATSPDSAPLDTSLALLRDAAQYFDAADTARRAGTQAPPAEPLARLRREGEGRPAPLDAVFQGVASAGGGLSLGSERARLSALWTSSAAAFCNQAIAGRYPLVRTAGKDVTPEDFGKFFAAGGTMDDFFSRHLAPHVDTSATRWRWRGGESGTGSLDISQDVLNQFQRAARLRDTFFSSGGRLPSLRFELRPVAADAGLARVVLDIDGQPVSHAAGQQGRSVSIVLPSGKGGNVVYFETTPALHAGLRTEGAWSWLRMVDRGRLEPTTQGERYRLSFDLDGQKMSYELSASSAINPFQRDALEQFRCPAGW